jgi:hypothetical protein
MSDDKKFNLIYRKKSSGEIKNFSRDRFRHYTAEDGTQMSKSQSWTEWEFQGKILENDRVATYNGTKKSAGKNVFYRAKETLRQLHYAHEISPSDKLENYLDGFIDCLNIFEGRD